MERIYHAGERERQRAYSPAVETRGGRIVWAAGHTGHTDGDGKSLAGDFEAQTRRIFARMEETLGRAGARLQDMVTMTVFIIDARYGSEFLKLRSEYFADGFPASALITCAGFAQPETLIEIQGIAVAED